MKKTLLFFTLFMAMLTIGVRAQVPVLTEGFEGTAIPTGWTTIDADNDGNSWEHSSVQEDVPGYNSNGSVVSYSYANATYTALTPDNWLISPALTLSGTSSLSFWFVVAQSYPADHFGVYVSTTSATDTSAFTLVWETTPTSVNAAWTQQTLDLSSYAGNTVYVAFRHFNCTDQFIIALDEITVSTMSSEPAIVAMPNALNFGTVLLGTSPVMSVDVVAFNSTAPISVSVTAPFAVSSDSITFGTSATLPAAGGTLYVQYEPAAVGTNTAVMALTAGTLSATVDLSGNCIDCSPITIPFVEDFEANSATLGCWSVANIASSTGLASNYPYSGSLSFVFSYSTNPPQYLISPELTGTGNGVKVEFMYRIMSTSYPESFAIGYSTTTNDISAFTWGVEQTNLTNTTYQLYEEIIPTADVKYISIKYTANDMYALFIDSLVIKEAPSCLPPVALTADNITTTGATLTWTGDAANYTIIDMSTGTVLATQAETTYSITGLTAMTQYTYGVVSNCTSGNSDTTTVTFTTACASVTLPYTETFESTSATRDCWDLISMNTGNAIGTSNGMGFYTINDREVLRFSSYSNHGGSNDYNQYGFSPLLDASSTATFLKADVTYATYGASDKLYFGYVTANDTVWDPTEYTTTGVSDWQTISYVFPANATQLAVNYYGNYSYYAWIDTVVVTEMTGEYCFPVTGLAASDITAHTATLSWTGDAGTYTIVNMTDGTVVATQADTAYNITGLASETQYTYGVVANCTTTSSDTVLVTFTTAISCPAPTGLAATLTPGNGTIATLTWTENGDATAWQICINDDMTNLIDVTATSYDLTNLTAEQAYTAKVRAICDVNDMSAWSNTITFTPTNAYSVTVNDGTVSSGYVPIYGLWVDDITKSQFIVPAADLAAMQYGTVNKLTFYSSTANVNWGVAEFNVYMTETTATTVDSLADYSTMTQVYAGTLSINNNIMEVTFSTPYLYMGGNLMIGFLQTVSGTYASSYWYGVEATGASMGGYGANISQRNFLPKMTIAYTPGAAPTCLPVTGLTASDVTDSQVTLSWTGTAASYNIYNGNAFVANTTNTTYTVTGLTAATNYVFGVRAVCSATDSSTLSTVAVSTPATETLTINLTINDPTLGSITPAPGTYVMAVNDSILLTATPNADVNFDGWRVIIAGQVAGTITSNPYTFPITSQAAVFGQLTIMAMFSDSTSIPDSLTVIVNTADPTMGTTNPAPGTYNYAVGEQSIIAAIPNPGYHNLYWIETISVAGMVVTDTLYADTVSVSVNQMMAGVTISITAYFEADSTPVVPCETPTDLHQVVVPVDKDPGFIQVVWTDNSGASKWNLQYRHEGAEQWNTVVTMDPSCLISYDMVGADVEAWEHYEIRVQAVCDDDLLSDWSDTIMATAQGYGGIDDYLLSSINLYPNPANDVVNVECRMQNAEYEVEAVEVYDVYGKLVNTVVVNENPIRINISNLADDMYFVRVTTDAGAVTKTFVKR